MPSEVSSIDEQIQLNCYQCKHTDRPAEEQQERSRDRREIDEINMMEGGEKDRQVGRDMAEGEGKRRKVEEMRKRQVNKSCKDKEGSKMGDSGHLDRRRCR